jgi:hypothetical protein
MNLQAKYRYWYRNMLTFLLLILYFTFLRCVIAAVDDILQGNDLNFVQRKELCQCIILMLSLRTSKDKESAFDVAISRPLAGVLVIIVFMISHGSYVFILPGV